jgi:hypothetical protein
MSEHVSDERVSDERLAFLTRFSSIGGTQGSLAMEVRDWRYLARTLVKAAQDTDDGMVEVKWDDFVALRDAVENLPVPR